MSPSTSRWRPSIRYASLRASASVSRSSRRRRAASAENANFSTSRSASPVQRSSARSNTLRRASARVAGEGHPPVAQERLCEREIDFFRAGIEAIARRRGRDSVGERSQRRPQPEHHDLQCGLRVQREVVTPQRLHERRPTHDPVGVENEASKERSLPRRCDRSQLTAVIRNPTRPRIRNSTAEG